jgi:hypothetical protein
MDSRGTHNDEIRIRRMFTEVEGALATSMNPAGTEGAQKTMRYASEACSLKLKFTEVKGAP